MARKYTIAEVPVISEREPPMITPNHIEKAATALAALKTCRTRRTKLAEMEALTDRHVDDGLLSRLCSMAIDLDIIAAVQESVHKMVAVKNATTEEEILVELKALGVKVDE